MNINTTKATTYELTGAVNAQLEEAINAIYAQFVALWERQPMGGDQLEAFIAQANAGDVNLPKIAAAQRFIRQHLGR